jgi:hypothetical protein
VDLNFNSKTSSNQTQEIKMSHLCIEAKKGQSCSSCGRTFSVNELVLAEDDGALICHRSCWRRLPGKASKVIPFRARIAATAPKSKTTPKLTARRTPVAAVAEGSHDGIVSGILKEEISKYANSLKGEED